MMDSNITSHARSFSLVKYTNFWSTLFGVQLFEVMRKTATYSLELISVIFFGGNDSEGQSWSVSTLLLLRTTRGRSGISIFSSYHSKLCEALVIYNFSVT